MFQSIFTFTRNVKFSKLSHRPIYMSSCRYLTILIILILVSLYAVDVFAQSRPYTYERRWRDSTVTADRKINIFKTNLLSYLAGDYTVTYERLSRNSPRSFVAKFDYNYYTSDEFDLWGPSLQAGLRYYLTRKRQPPAGYYVQPFFTYSEYTVHDKLQNAGAHVALIGGGIMGGIQWAIGNRFTVEVFLGGEYVSLTANNYRAKGVVETFLPLVGGATGFRF